MVTFRGRVPKKHLVDAKHFVLCKQHGGTHNTHNTTECCKYEKDGTPKMSFTRKSMQRNPCSRSAPCEQNTSYVQLSMKIAKLEKSNKKLKHANKKCKHDHNSNSNNSDSS
jgi:hypothetical protein